MTMKMANNNEQSFENAQIEIKNNKIEKKKICQFKILIYTHILLEKIINEEKSELIFLFHSLILLLF